MADFVIANLTDGDKDIMTGVFISLFFLVCLPLLILCVFCAMALLFARSLNWPMRVALINLFANEFCYWLATSIDFIVYYAQNGGFPCIIASLSAVAAITKFQAIALYAVLVYIFVKFGIKKVKMCIIILYTVISWVAALAFGAIPYTPEFSVISGACDFFNYTSPIVFVPLGVASAVIIACLSVTVVFSTLSFCYVKNNTLEGDVELKTAATKNLAYLIFAAALSFVYNFIPISYPAIFSAVSPAVSIVLNFVLNLPPIGLSIATPIVTIAVLKPVNSAIKNILKKMCCHCKKHRVAPENSHHIIINVKEINLN